MFQKENRSPYLRFLKAVAVFSLPLVLVFGVFDVIAIKAGELASLDSIVRSQNEKKDKVVLYGRKVVDQELRKYKYKLHEERPAEIIALGSSRILSMREEHFAPHYTFTNVGSIAHNLGDIEDFASRLATSTERKYIFLSPDHYWFGAKRTGTGELTRDLGLLDANKDWRAHVFAVRYLVSTALRDMSRFKNYISSQNPFHDSFGFQGQEGNGYLRDGSYLYGSFLTELRGKNEYKDREQPSIIDRVKAGAGSYAANSEYVPERTDRLKIVLANLKAKNYFVIGLGLPFSTEVYDELRSNPGQKDLFAKFQEDIPKAFEVNGFVYADYSDLKKMGLSDLYMFDGVHSSDTLMAIILIDVLKRHSKSNIPKRDLLIKDLESKVRSPNTKTFELDYGTVAL